MSYRLVLDARLLHYNRTGIGRYIRHLYGAMAALAPEREMCIGYSRRDGERRLADVWPRGTSLWTPPHHRLERWTLAAEVLRLRPRVLHSPDHVGPKPVGWRSVLTVHDLAFWRMPESHEPASREYYDGLRRSASEAARIICVSDATKRDLLAVCPQAEPKVRVVHEAPDSMYVGAAGPHPPPARGHPALPEGEGTGPEGRSMLVGEQPYFIFVGTISPRKNVARIVEAFARVVGRRGVGERPALVIVGADGYDASRVHRLPAELGIERDVRFVGAQPAREVARLYRSTLALVFPSLLEGFGLPVLEAMAVGAPVITSDRSSLPEVAGEAALLVDPEQTDELSEAMWRVATDEALRVRLRSAGLSRAVHFTWERAARETLAVFDEAAA